MNPAKHYVLFLIVAFTPTLSAQESITDTEAGKRLVQLVEVVNQADSDTKQQFLKEAFVENDEATVKKRSLQTKQIGDQFGRFEIEKIVRSSQHEISAIVKTKSGPKLVLTLKTEEESPFRISRIAIEVGDEDGTEVDTSPITADIRKETLDNLTEELKGKYVFPEVADKMVEAINSEKQKDTYNEIEDPQEFASLLTEQLREICKDKHLRVIAGTPRRSGSRPGRRPSDNHGFVKAEMLPGGIGYLKLNYFSGDESAKETAAAAMNFLGNSRALVFDLRENGGGSPSMIAFLTSYLFEEPTHLNSFYNRPSDTTTESWTQKEVPGKRFAPTTPVFVLTSSYTFSGAEEFSYNLKNLKRGTIVGETTGGGAHPVMMVGLSDRFYISMPFARAINPITNTNWEGVGVKPDVEVDSDAALEKALELAEQQLEQMESETKTSTKAGDDNVGELLEKMDQLMADQSFAEAIPVLEQIIEADPDNELAWFRLGYCLHMEGKLDRAIKAHKKAAATDQFAGIATYNLACAYALKDDADQSLKYLEKAIELGFNDARQLANDTDFANLKDDERFKDILEKLKSN